MTTDIEEVEEILRKLTARREAFNYSYTKFHYDARDELTDLMVENLLNEYITIIRKKMNE